MCQNNDYYGVNKIMDLFTETFYKSIFSGIVMNLIKQTTISYRGHCRDIYFKKCRTISIYCIISSSNSTLESEFRDQYGSGIQM